MKNLYLYIILLFFTATTVLGQVEIYNGASSTTNIAGQVINVSLFGSEYEGYIYVKNISGHTKSFKLIRKQLSPIDFSLTEQICFGSASGNRYLVNKDLETYEFPAVLSLNNNEKGIIEYVFGNYDIPADINYRYYLADGDDVLVDSVDVKVVATLGVKENVKTSANVSVASFPNPVTNLLTVNVTGSNDNTVKIVDILGKVMYFEKIGTTKKIDVSDLNNGVYILTVTSANGTILQNKKIIVKH